MDTKPKRADWLRRSIVVRKRTLNETRDLALLVFGRQFKSLLFYYSWLFVPVYLLDLLLWSYLTPISDLTTEFPLSVGVTFKFWFYVIVVWATITYETAFIGSLATQYLGLWLFSPNERELNKEIVFRSWFSKWFQIFYYTLLTRIIQLNFFHTEIILLERTPFLKRDQRISTRARVNNVNRGVGSTRLFQVISTESYVFFGVISAVGLIQSCAGAFFPDQLPLAIVMTRVVAPLVVFGSKLYDVVFNFLSYINYRITSEGWDLDLAFKMELNKETEKVEEDVDVATPRRFRRSKTLGALVLDSNLDVDVSDSSEENAL